jgi:hypothetical protein
VILCCVLCIACDIMLCCVLHVILCCVLCVVYCVLTITYRPKYHSHTSQYHKYHTHHNTLHNITHITTHFTISHTSQHTSQYHTHHNTHHNEHNIYSTTNSPKIFFSRHRFSHGMPRNLKIQATLRPQTSRFGNIQSISLKTTSQLHCIIPQ